MIGTLGDNYYSVEMIFNERVYELFGRTWSIVNN